MKYLYPCRFLRSLIGVQANTVAEPKANVAGPNQNGAISEQTFYNWKTEPRRALAAFRKIVPRVKLPLHDLSSNEVVAGLHNATLELEVILKPTGEHTNAFISCAQCHVANAASDMVLTQYYPVLRAAKGPK